MSKFCLGAVTLLMGLGLAGSVAAQAPQLEGGSVSPLVGFSWSTYTFTVVYHERPAPTTGNPVVRVIVNGTPYTMSRETTGTPDFVNGERFRVQIPGSQLNQVGSNSFYFTAVKGLNSAILPPGAPGDQFSGPHQNDAPVLSSGTATPLAPRIGQGVTYSVNYRDVNNDAPRDGYPIAWVGNDGGWQFNGGVITRLNNQVTLIADNTRNWTPSQFAGALISWQTGDRVGSQDIILDNTANTLIVQGNLASVPATAPKINDQFQINIAGGAGSTARVTALDFQAAYITDTGRTLTSGALSGQRLNIVSGSGMSAIFTIATNTANGIALSDRSYPSVSTNPDLVGAGVEIGDSYSIGDILAAPVADINFNDAGFLSLRFPNNPNWTANQFAGLLLYVVSAADANATGRVYLIHSNTSNTLRFAQNPLVVQTHGLANGDMVRVGGLSTSHTGSSYSSLNGVTCTVLAPSGLGVGDHTVFWQTANVPTVGGVSTAFQSRFPSGSDVLVRPRVTSDPPPGNQAPVLRNAVVSPSLGTTLTNFDFSVDYIDAEGNPPGPHSGVVGHITLFLQTQGGTITRVYRSSVDPDNAGQFWPVPFNVNDPADPAWRTLNVAKVPSFRIAAGTLASGSYRYHFEASDGYRTTRFPSNPATDPLLIVNSRPILSSPGVSPATGNTGTLFRFRVVYTDADNVAPNTLNIIITRDGVDLPAVPVTVKEDPAAINFATGVAYIYETTLAAGNYSFRFTASDALESASPTFPVTGPVVRATNVAPSLLSGTVTPASSSLAGNSFDYSVRYRDTNGDTPNFVRVTIFETDGVTVRDTFDMVKANPADDNYIGTNGVLYVKTGYSFNAAGRYFYRFSASDGLANATGDTGIKAGPIVNTPPVLNNPSLNPLSGLSSEPFTFSVEYSDLDNVGPTENGYVRVVLDRSGDITRLDMQPQAASGWNTGVEYRLVTQIPAGVYTYYFEASDGFDQAVDTAVTAGPTVEAAPELRNASVTPATGRSTDTFTYRVTVANPDGTGPSEVKLFIDTTSEAQAVDMIKVNPADNNFASGVQYQYLTTLSPGAHTWFIRARIAGETLYPIGQSPGNPAVGPVVNNPPVLSSALVTPTFGRTDTVFTYRVTYRDADGIPPGAGGFVRVHVSGMANPIEMTPTGANWAGGVVYEANTTLPGGNRTFFMTASDGIETVRFPAGSGSFDGPRVSSAPVLSSPSVTPATGNLSTVFTYRVVYSDADGDAPADGSVKVLIDGQPFVMSKQNPLNSDYVGGVAYVYSTTLSSGDHNYLFQASDGVDLVSTALMQGPTVAVSGITVNAAPNPAPLGELINVTGQVLPARVAQIRVTASRPNGTQIVRNINSASNGSYNTTFVADEVGTWGVVAADVNDSAVRATLTPALEVQPATLRVQGGVVDMISSPVVTPTGDPGDIFGIDIARALQIVRWDPLTAVYYFYGSATQFPILTSGSGFWIRPDATRILTLSGSLPDQTQSISVPVYAGWNQIGSGFVQPVNWSSVRVRYLGETVSLAVASQRGWIRDYAWGYNPATGEYTLVQGAGGRLDPYRGYWIRAFVNCELLVQPPVSN